MLCGGDEELFIPTANFFCKIILDSKIFYYFCRLNSKCFY